MKINYKYVGELEPPKRQTEGAAGIDLFNNAEDITLYAKSSRVFETGTFVEIPEGYVGLVFVRSSMGFKRDVTLSNSVGVIDSDYRGEIKVKLYNHSCECYEIKRGERIAQLVIVPCFTGDYNLVDELSDTKRGEGGFGSTGQN